MRFISHASNDTKPKQIKRQLFIYLMKTLCPKLKWMSRMIHIVSFKCAKVGSYQNWRTATTKPNDFKINGLSLIWRLKVTITLNHISSAFCKFRLNYQSDPGKRCSNKNNTKNIRKSFIFKLILACSHFVCFS